MNVLTLILMQMRVQTEIILEMLETFETFLSGVKKHFDFQDLSTVLLDPFCTGSHTKSTNTPRIHIIHAPSSKTVTKRPKILD
jgi:hypothetical protein